MWKDGHVSRRILSDRATQDGTGHRRLSVGKVFKNPEGVACRQSGEAKLVGVMKLAYESY